MKNIYFLCVLLLLAGCSSSDDGGAAPKETQNLSGALSIMGEGETTPSVFYDFGSRISATQNKVAFIVKNTTQSVVQDIQLTSTNQSFQLSSNACPAALGVSASCRIEMNFIPENSGSYAGNIIANYTIGSSAGSSLRRIKGESKKRALLTIDKSILSFENLALPAQQSIPILVKNLGEIPAENFTLSTSALPLTVPYSTCGTSILPGSSCTLNFQFQSFLVTSGSVTQVFQYFDGVSTNQTSIVLNYSTTNGSFNVAKGMDLPVFAIETSNNGNVFVGGSFTSFAEKKAGHALKFFGSLSIDTLYPVETGFNGDVLAIGTVADKTYYGGKFSTFNNGLASHLVRLDANGVIDPSFDIGTGFDGNVHCLAIDSNGKLLVGGDFQNFNGTQAPLFIRLNPDGSIDNSFVLGTGFTGTAVYAIGIDSNDKILLGGSFSNYKGSAVQNLVRLSSAGTIDATFITSTATDGAILTILVEANDGMYLGGEFTSFKGSSSPRIVRLTSNGNKEPLFNVGTGFNSTVRTLEGSDSDINFLYVGGDFTRYQTTTIHSIVKLDPLGAIDNNFVQGNGFSDSVKKIKRLSDDTLLVGGNFHSYSIKSVNRLAHLTSNGSFIPTFNEYAGVVGKVSTSLPLTDGKVLVAGELTRVSAETAPKVALLSMHGESDTSLDTGAGFDASVVALIASPFKANAYLLGGQFTQYNTQTRQKLAQVFLDGSLDTSFNIGTGFNGSVNTLLAKPDSVYVGGQFTTYQGATAFGLIRLKSTGGADSAFVTGTGFTGIVWALAEASNDKIYVAGDFTNYNGTPVQNIVRLNADGSLDSSFAFGSGFNLPIWTIATDSSGNLYAGGDFSTYQGTAAEGLIKIKPDGSIDSTFSVGSGFDGSVNSIAVANDGAVYATGSFTHVQGNAYRYLVKLKPTGAIDPLFTLTSGLNAEGWTVKFAKDGSDDIYVGGSFTSYNSVTTDHFIRLSKTGALE